jgi:hypothetical protein
VLWWSIKCSTKIKTITTFNCRWVLFGPKPTRTVMKPKTPQPSSIDTHVVHIPSPWTRHRWTRLRLTATVSC